MTDPQTPTSEADDAELCARILAHSPDSEVGRLAFGELYHRHRHPALHFAIRLTGDQIRAEDVVAEAFAKIWRAWGNGAGPQESFKSYLMTAVRSESYRLTATTSATTAVEPEVLDVLAGSSDRDHASEVSERDQLARAFRGLPETWQQALTMIDIDGAPTAEAARRLDLSPNSFNSLLHRAREGLRTAYLQEHVEPPRPACAAYSSELARYVRNQLGRKRGARIESHLRHCRYCRRQSVLLIRLNTTLAAWLTPAVLAAALIEADVFPAPPDPGPADPSTCTTDPSAGTTEDGSLKTAGGDGTAGGDSAVGGLSTAGVSGQFAAAIKIAAAAVLAVSAVGFTRELITPAAETPESDGGSPTAPMRPPTTPDPPESESESEAEAGAEPVPEPEPSIAVVPVIGTESTPTETAPAPRRPRPVAPAQPDGRADPEGRADLDHPVLEAPAPEPRDSADSLPRLGANGTDDSSAPDVPLPPSRPQPSPDPTPIGEAETDGTGTDGADTDGTETDGSTDGTDTDGTGTDGSTDGTGTDGATDDGHHCHLCIP